jgi:hypothetical protein
MATATKAFLNCSSTIKDSIRFIACLIQADRRFLANPIVMDEIYTVDFLDPTKADIRGDGASVRSSDQLIWKYLGLNTGSTTRAPEESYAHWIMYRYADILLMKAEAQNQLGNGQDALDIIKIIRDRARALISTAANPAPTDRSGHCGLCVKRKSKGICI